VSVVPWGGWETREHPSLPRVGGELAPMGHRRRQESGPGSRTEAEARVTGDLLGAVGAA